MMKKTAEQKKSERALRDGFFMYVDMHEENKVRSAEGKTTKQTFRGRQVMRGWPKYLKQNQAIKTLTHRSGKVFDRVPNDKGRCHDCSAIDGEFHVIGCDMERCPKCGKQLICCGHFKLDPL